MKKIIYIFTAIIAILLFYYFYEITNNQIFFKTDQYESYADDILLNYLLISSKDDKSSILSEVLNMAKEEKSTIVYCTTGMNNQNKTAKQFYIYAPSKLKTPLYLKDKNKVIDFSKDDYDKYYTSYYEDKDAYNYLTAFDDSYFNSSDSVLYFYPFCQSFDNINDISYMAIYVYSNNIDLFVEKLKKACQQNNIMLEIENNTAEFHQADDELYVEDNLNKLFYAFIISLVAYIVAYCVLLTKDNKKICIYMLNGYNKVIVALKLYLPLLIKVLFVFLMTLMICVLVFTNINESIYYQFYQRLVYYSGIFIIFIPMALICMIIYIHFSSSYLNLKNNRYLNKVLYTNYVIKIIIGTILLQPFVTTVNASLPLINDYRLITKYQEVVTNNQSLAGDFYSFDRKLVDHFMEIGYFFDFETYRVYSDQNNQFLYDHNGDFQIDKYMKHPYIMANKNYLNVFDYSIKDVSGKIVDINALEDDTLLVPKKYQNDNLKPYYIGISEEPKIIYVEDTGSYFDFHLIMEESSLKDPIIRIYNSFDMDYITNSNLLLPVNEQYDDEYYQDLIHDYHLDGSVSFYKTESYYRYYLQVLKERIIDMTGLICLYTFVFGLFLYQSTYTYFIKNAKKIAIEYLLGINRFKRIQELLMQNVCIYLSISIISLLLVKNSVASTLEFVLFFIIVELLMQFILFRYNEKYNLIGSLKGE